MPHDEMVALAEAEGVTKTVSWMKGGAYSKPRPSKATIAACAPYRFTPIEAVATEAAGEVAST